MHHGEVAGLTDLGDHPAKDDAALGRRGVVAQDVETEAGQSLTQRVSPPVRLAGQQPGLLEQGEGAVQAFLKERISSYKVPRIIRICDTFPREDSGKVKKHKLRQTLFGEIAA